VAFQLVTISKQTSKHRQLTAEATGEQKNERKEKRKLKKIEKKEREEIYQISEKNLLQKI